MSVWQFRQTACCRPYNTLFAGTGKLFKDEGNGIDRTAFWSGYVQYAFDLTSDLGENNRKSFSAMRSRVVAYATLLSTGVTTAGFLAAGIAAVKCVPFPESRPVGMTPTNGGL